MAAANYHVSDEKSPERPPASKEAIDRRAVER
jgi:hypothetical protein